MNNYLQQIERTIQPLRDQIINHPVYASIRSIEDLNVFMEYHVFAVWDFMSLLKSLQLELTCTSVPWFPVGNADTRFLINEIVAGEESDVDSFGNRKSHFEMYLDAMDQSGATTVQIDQFLKELKSSGNLNSSFLNSGVPKEAQDFVQFTFDTIEKGAHIQSAVFTFGREDLIPNMFLSIVNDIYQRLPESVSIFKYYLERHIEVDGDHHSHLALEMTAKLCGNDEHLWREAELATVQSLQQRINLWDGAYRKIQMANVEAVV